MRKLPWWLKDKRPTQAEQIKTFQKSRKRIARTLSRVAPPRDPLAAAPTLQEIRHAMAVAELEASNARMPRPNFSFSPQQVIAIYKKRDGEPGTWFQLDNGRIIRSTGEPDTTNPDEYD